jgi:hypothetical protein
MQYTTEYYRNGYRLVKAEQGWVVRADDQQIAGPFGRMKEAENAAAGFSTFIPYPYAMTVQ